MKSEKHNERDKHQLKLTDSFISEESKDKENKEDEEYILYPYRWLMQFAFCMAMASTGFI